MPSSSLSVCSFQACENKENLKNCSAKPQLLFFRFRLALCLFLTFFSFTNGECIDTQVKVTAADGAADDHYGSSVAISGSVAMIGAPFDDDHGASSGAVYFQKESSPGLNDWASTVVKVTPDLSFVPDAGDLCGHAVAISGQNAIISCPQLYKAGGTYYPWIYFYHESSPGLADWASNEVRVIDPLLAGTDISVVGKEAYGSCVDISTQDAIVGNYWANNGDGQVFFYTESTLGQQDWGSNTLTLSSSDGAGTGQYFGHAVGIDELVAVVGAPTDADIGSNAGACYIYTQTGLGALDWGNELKLSASDLSTGDKYGYSLALAETTVALGAQYQNSKQGAVYVYYNDGADWASTEAKLTANDGTSNSLYGACIALNGLSLVIGAQITGFVYYYKQSFIGAQDWELTQSKIVASDDVLMGFAVAMTGTYDDVTGAAHSVILAGAWQDDEFFANGGATYFITVSCDGNQCASSPCLHSGSCTDQFEGYDCDCTGTGFDGDYCGSDIDDCVSTPCQNAGVCTDTGSYMFECNCTGTGYTGGTCEDDENDCLSSPCENGGNCSDIGIFAYDCVCASGWEGSECQTDVEDCASSPCLYNGLCADTGTNSFECNCNNTGYEGLYCSVEVDDCGSSPCLNDATCKDKLLDFKCICEPGYEGSTCESDIDDCASSPCLHGSLCVDSGVQAVMCDCTSTGFEGSFCENDVDDCLSCPCLNGATCRDNGLNDVTCDCAAGFDGSSCELDIDDCLSNPCSNDGTCSDTGTNTFECACPVTHSGDLCDVEVNISPSDFETVTLTITFDSFANESETLDMFAYELQYTILPVALGGYPSDYEVLAVQSQDGSYTVTIISQNREGYDDNEATDMVVDYLNSEEPIINKPIVQAHSDEEESSAGHVYMSYFVILTLVVTSCVLLL